MAAVPNWFEVQMADGRAGYVSKRSTDLGTCPAGVGIQPSGSPVTVATPSQFELHAIDVGTGLAVLVRGPDFTLMYDAGSNDDTTTGEGNRAVAYLKTLQPAITRIDHVILSHPHQDHVQLLGDVVRAYRPRAVWNSGAFNGICGYRDFLSAIAADSSIQYHTAHMDTGEETVALKAQTCIGSPLPEGNLVINHASRINNERIQLGQSAFMTVLYANGSQASSFNENSLVVRLDLGNKRILFMGDADAGGRKSPTVAPSDSSIEGKLLACCSQDLKAEVLVVGHHGSKTSSRTRTLNAIGASTFVVSAGPKKYATVVLPDSEVVDELEARGTVFRTDREDDQCGVSTTKYGTRADDKPGGCDNIVLRIPATGTITGDYRTAP